MLERQREGIAKAKAGGKYKGRPVSIDAAAIRKALEAGETPTALAKRLRVARNTVYRLMVDQAEAARDAAVVARRNRRNDPAGANAASTEAYEIAMLAEKARRADAPDA